MVVVGMFDDAASLEDGLARLAEAGLDERLQKLEGPAGPGTPGAAGASEGGAEPLDLPRSEAVVAPWPGSLWAADEEELLGGSVLDDEERAYYRRLLEDGGRIVVVELEEERVDEAERLLTGAGATRVARHVV
jgi:hypothetical protein